MILYQDCNLQLVEMAGNDTNGTARIESGTPLRENGTVFLKWYTLILP